MNYSLAVASTAEGHYSRNGSLIVKTLTNYHDEEEIFATQQLRYEVFCERIPGAEFRCQVQIQPEPEKSYRRRPFGKKDRGRLVPVLE